MIYVLHAIKSIKVKIQAGNSSKKKRFSTPDNADEIPVNI
jgi:hypothetical protein